MKNVLLAFVTLFLPLTASAGYYSVLSSSYGDLIVYDGDTAYSINTSWDCSSSDFSQGDAIYIDGYFGPSWGDTIVYEGLFDTDTCDVTSAEELNLQEYYLEAQAGTDKVILTDSWGDQYLVEYGVGCLSMWRYVDEYIYVDVGGAFLDAIGDTIYLLDDGDSCRVWDVDELNSSAGVSSSYSVSIDDLDDLYTYSCPEHATYKDDGCYCDDNYYADNEKNECVSIDKLCKAEDPHTFWNGRKDVCQCVSGYVVNQSTGMCVDEDDYEEQDDEITEDAKTEEAEIDSQAETEEDRREVLLKQINDLLALIAVLQAQIEAQQNI
jgi:hypothetical protein